MKRQPRKTRSRQTSSHARRMGRHDAPARPFERLESRQLLSGDVLATLVNDLNGNGVKDVGEPGLQGWTVFVDYDGNRVLSAGEPSAVSGTDGKALITGVIGDDNWDIREIVKPGFAPSKGFSD